MYGGSATPSSNTAYSNVAIGYMSMYGTPGTASIGYENVAVGNDSLGDNTSGFENTAI